ncbi:hypothetical protein AcW1_006732 [Taiwanofungus camphoratus]|nr:hypothetical protein AcV5_009321 [Antrodia cinnamomea]KAI0953953.1 hypothetical protein AcV7_007335 [Antrodia cinnamomea]KAI0955021.1 hypothetical protein AcW1_006732 [Antrodia cinnamomea]
MRSTTLYSVQLSWSSGLSFDSNIIWQDPTEQRVRECITAAKVPLPFRDEFLRREGAPLCFQYQSSSRHNGPFAHPCAFGRIIPWCGVMQVGQAFILRAALHPRVDHKRSIEVRCQSNRKVDVPIPLLG